MEQLQSKEGWIARIKSEGYLSIRARNGAKLHGGNQNWYWEKTRENELRLQGVKTRFEFCKKDENYRLASLGCGVIAMINLENYLLRKKNLESSNSLKDEIDQKIYEDYAAKRWKDAYHVNKSYLNYVTGLYPWRMENGLSHFLLEHGFERKKVTWAPYVLKPVKTQSKLVLAAIREMLSSDFPVVFSYHTFQPKEHSIVMYHDLEAALKGDVKSGADTSVGSHYMTIIGLYHSENVGYVLCVESWGKIYYIRYSSYAKALSYFTNILYVRENKDTGEEK